jgi:glycosyltransferase involved in cell wall biosynthesis
MRAPRLIHVTTTDMSLDWLLGPQLGAFVEAGFEVYGASAPGPHADALPRWGVTHLPLHGATRAMNLGADFQAMRELLRLFRDFSPDIVHTHNPKPGVYGRLAARAARVPVIVNTVHGLYAQPGDWAGKRAAVYGLERLAASCSKAELVQNPEDLETLKRIGVSRRKLRLLGNGVDLQRFEPETRDSDRIAAIRREFGAGPDDIVCGFVGRLVWEKGYREVFAAARLLALSAPNVRVVVIGPREGDKDDSVTEVDVRMARSQANIEFLDQRDDMEDLYAAMDIYGLASYREGFPRSAMEAAAMGLPVVATDIRGCREVVDHEETGLLVPVEDARGLADGIGRIAGDPSMRIAMGESARKKAERDFDQERVIQITLDTYRDLLSRAGCPFPTP